MTLLQEIFGSFSTGRIGRVRFVLLTLLLSIAMLATGFGLGFGAAIGDWLQSDAAPSWRPAAGLAGLTVFLAVGVAVVVGTLNLVAKRARDIGWPAVWLVLLFLITSGLVGLLLAVVPGRPTAAGSP